jgi:hypothetical protein
MNTFSPTSITVLPYHYHMFKRKEKENNKFTLHQSDEDNIVCRNVTNKTDLNLYFLNIIFFDLI